MRGAGGCVTVTCPGRNQKGSDGELGRISFRVQTAQQQHTAEREREEASSVVDRIGDLNSRPLKKRREMPVLALRFRGGRRTWRTQLGFVKQETCYCCARTAALQCIAYILVRQHDGRAAPWRHHHARCHASPCACAWPLVDASRSRFTGVAVSSLRARTSIGWLQGARSPQDNTTSTLEGRGTGRDGRSGE